MITAFDVYLVGMLDSIKESTVFIVLLSVCAILVGASILIIANTSSYMSDEQISRLIKVGKRTLITSIIITTIFLGVHTFLPSSRLAAAMYILPAAANNEDLQKIGGDSLKILRELTEKWLQGVVTQEKSEKLGTL